MLQEGNMKVTDSDRKWLLLIHRVPVEPSTLRVKAWRKMKEIGALYLQQSAAICPLLDSKKGAFGFCQGDQVCGRRSPSIRGGDGIGR